MPRIARVSHRIAIRKALPVGACVVAMPRCVVFIRMLAWKGWLKLAHKWVELRQPRD